MTHLEIKLVERLLELNINMSAYGFKKALWLIKHKSTMVYIRDHSYLNFHPMSNLDALYPINKKD